MAAKIPHFDDMPAKEKLAHTLVGMYQAQSDTRREELGKEFSKLVTGSKIDGDTGVICDIGWFKTGEAPNQLINFMIPAEWLRRNHYVDSDGKELGNLTVPVKINDVGWSFKETKLQEKEHSIYPEKK